MAASLSDSQNEAIEIAEKVTSALSLTGLAFIFVTFTFSPKFRKPINRLMFYAAWGDALYNISTLVATSGIAAGASSTLCQFQGFMIEMFLLSDILWNLSMAVNVYLTVFAKYDSSKLKSLETKYLCFNYGVPFIIAFTLCFVENEARGKVYGPALIWCWISLDWDFLRIVLLYAPAWIIILIIGIIYVVSGLEISRKRRLLDQFGAANASINTTCTAGDHNSQNMGPGPKVQVTTELSHTVTDEMALETGLANAPYSVTIEGKRSGYSFFSKRPSRFTHPSFQAQRPQKRSQASERTSAAWSYTKCAILFFVALLITWLPSSVNRVYSLIHPTSINWPLNLSAAIVLPLMGFWNTVIYVFISWRAVRELFIDEIPWSSLLPARRGLGHSTNVGIGSKKTAAGINSERGSGPWTRMNRTGSGGEVSIEGALGSDVKLTTMDTSMA